MEYKTILGDQKLLMRRNICSLMDSLIENLEESKDHQFAHDVGAMICLFIRSDIMRLELDKKQSQDRLNDAETVFIQHFNNIEKNDMPSILAFYDGFLDQIKKNFKPIARMNNNRFLKKLSSFLSDSASNSQVAQHLGALMAAGIQDNSKILIKDTKKREEKIEKIIQSCQDGIGVLENYYKRRAFFNAFMEGMDPKQDTDKSQAPDIG